MTPKHLKTLKTQVADLILEASHTLILPRFRALGEDQIQSKTSPDDLVTIADIEAEAWLTPRLAELLPGSQVLGEEAVSRGEAEVSVLEGSDPVWVIDPVDGTYNFAHGNEAFCCMVALVQGRKVQAGWIYFPTERRLYWAGLGLGAWRKEAEESETQLLLKSPETQGAVSYRFFKRPALKEKRSQILSALAPTQYTKCAGMDYRRAAEGLYGFVAMATLTPWDHAPGTLLVQEAGGEVRLDRKAYDPSIEAGTLVSGGHAQRLLLVENLLIS